MLQCFVAVLNIVLLFKYICVFVHFSKRLYHIFDRILRSATNLIILNVLNHTSRKLKLNNKVRF